MHKYTTLVSSAEGEYGTRVSASGKTDFWESEFHLFFQAAHVTRNRLCRYRSRIVCKAEHLLAEASGQGQKLVMGAQWREEACWISLAGNHRLARRPSRPLRDRITRFYGNRKNLWRHPSRERETLTRALCRRSCYRSILASGLPFCLHFRVCECHLSRLMEWSSERKARSCRWTIFRLIFPHGWLFPGVDSFWKSHGRVEKEASFS